METTMGRELPDYAFDGMAGMGGFAGGMRGMRGMGNDLLFDRSQLAALAFSTPREEMAGVADFFKKVGGAVGGVAKAVGKGAVNAAASRVGIGPVFTGPTASIVNQPAGNALTSAPPPAKSYTPWIIGGAAVGVLGLILLLRK